jgi:lactoylglutathione lyase
MKATIEHVAMWTTDLQRSKEFYAKYFGADAGREYANPSKGFRSIFLSFEGGARIELMQKMALRSWMDHAEPAMVTMKVWR